MSRSTCRPRHAIAAGVRQILKEGLISVEELAQELGLARHTLVRWITRGKMTAQGRIWMDGLSRPQIGWMTSREAVQRFREATAGEVGEAG